MTTMPATPRDTPPAAAELLADFLPTALSLARRWARLHPHLADDFASAAAEAAWLAATDFDPARGSYPGLATFRVRLACCDVVRIARRRCRYLPPSILVTDDMGREVPAADLLADDEPGPAEAAERADDADRVRRLLARLPERWRELVERHTGHGEPLARIAAGRGLQRASVTDMHGRALRRLRGLAGTGEGNGA